MVTFTLLIAPPFGVLATEHASDAASSVAPGHCERLELLLRNAAGPPEEEQGEGDTDPCEDRDREEGRLEALGQRHEAVPASVCRQVVVGAGDGHTRDDRDPERRPDLEAGVA